MSTYTRTHLKYYLVHKKEISKRLLGSLARKAANKKYYDKNKDKFPKYAKEAKKRLKIKQNTQIRQSLYKGVKDSFKTNPKDQ